MLMQMGLRRTRKRTIAQLLYAAFAESVIACVTLAAACVA